MKLFIALIGALYGSISFGQVKVKHTDSGYVIRLKPTEYIHYVDPTPLIQLFPKPSTPDSTIKIFDVLNYVTEKAQSLDKDDNMFLYRTIDTFLNRRDVIIKNKKMEVCILTLDVDSMGRINDIHILSDEERRDHTYSLLCQLRPNIFHGRMFKNCKNKLIIIPFITTTDSKTVRSYADRIKANLFGFYEENHIILAKTFYYLIPEYACEGYVSETTGSYIDSTKKKD